MTRISQFVALVLVLAAVAWPAAALTACLTHSDDAGSGMKCPPGCPMMAKQSDAGDRVAAASQGAPCCKISSGKSAPAPVASSPVRASHSVVVPVKIVIPMAVPVQPQHRPSVVEGSVPDTSPQAVLCTFLI